MKERFKVGIVGYGNIGRGVEQALSHAEDMSLEAIFTRRDPAEVKAKSPAVKVLHFNNAEKYVGELDVLILCGGSATDLPEQGPFFASMFNIVDSFDTHAKIPAYFAAVDAAAQKAGKVGVISTGWDPGLFSIARLYQAIALPQGTGFTFWGPGVSQGHSDAVRRVPGVKDARQYTIPVSEVVERIRQGENPELTTREKHLRDCYVVAEPEADQDAIRKAIVSMPHYFSDYDTTVTFITETEMKEQHCRMPHGGFVMRTGETSEGTRHVMEFSLKLESNPEFTGTVLIAYARAAVRLQRRGESGAKTVFDIAPGLLSPGSAEELRAEML